MAPRSLLQIGEAQSLKSINQSISYVLTTNHESRDNLDFELATLVWF